MVSSGKNCSPVYVILIFRFVQHWKCRLITEIWLWKTTNEEMLKDSQLCLVLFCIHYVLLNLWTWVWSNQGKCFILCKVRLPRTFHFWLLCFMTIGYVAVIENVSWLSTRYHLKLVIASNDLKWNKDNMSNNYLLTIHCRCLCLLSVYSWRYRIS